MKPYWKSRVFPFVPFSAYSRALSFGLMLGMVLIFDGGLACRVVDEGENPIFVQSPSRPQATYGLIDGEPVTLESLDNKMRREIYSLESKAYEDKKRAFEELVTQRVVQKEAEKRGLTVAELLEHEVFKPSVSEGEAQAEQFLVKNEDQVKKWIEEELQGLDGKSEEDLMLQETVNVVERIIGASLKKRHQNEVLSAYVNGLKRQAEVRFLLDPPDHLRLHVPVDDQPYRGKENAPMQIIEFGSYGDELTTRLEETLEKVAQERLGQIRWVFCHHPKSQRVPIILAHQMAACAALQGQFWPLHKILIKNWHQLHFEKWQDFVQNPDHQKDLQKLALVPFERCMVQKDFEAPLNRDQQVVKDLEMVSRMTIYVNGIEVEGMQGPEVLSQVLDREADRLTLYISKN